MKTRFLKQLATMNLSPEVWAQRQLWWKQFVTWGWATQDQIAEIEQQIDKTPIKEKNG